MNDSLHSIKQKINSLQHGLLRFNDKKQGYVTLQVKATISNGITLNCIVTEDLDKKRKFINKDVNLIQKGHNDYLYINGKITNEVHNGSRILSIRIIKACWFVRKTQGSLSWFKEKHVFESSVIELELAS